jgi:TolA-binding protein
MKQNRLAILVISALAFLVCAEVQAQSTVDGQPSVLKEDKGQSNYVYDLKLLIKKSKDNIKDVNEKIKEQAVIKRNQQREDKAREYYEQALKLQEEGRLEEARQIFDKAIRITEHPEMKYYIKESERRSKLQQVALQREETDQERRAQEDQKLVMERAENSYQTAVNLYKQQKFREAKDEFILVEELYPDYKAVRSYLQIIEQDIVQSEHLDMKEQKSEIERQQKEEEIARLREKELWRKEVDKKEQERQQQLRKQAQGVYEEALKLFDERKYMAARDKFQEVEWVVPDYKATRTYLNRIEGGIDDQKKEITQERQRELEKQRWQEALSDKKSTEERRKAIEQREQEHLMQVKDQAEFVYVAAVALFEKDLLEQSKEKFNEVEGIYPNYKSSRDYLKRIDQVGREKIEREALKKKTEDERRIWEEEMDRRKEDKQKFKLLASEADIFYKDAMALYQTGRLIEAKEKFLEVDQRVPDYKSTRSYLKRIDDDIELLVKTQRVQDSLVSQREEIEKMRMMRDKAEEVYRQAVEAYEVRNFDVAADKFRETEGIYPDYKKTKLYLGQIEDNIRSQQEMAARAEREKEAAVLYGEAVAFYQARQFEDAKKKFLAVQDVLTGYKETSDFLGRIDDDILKKKENDLLQIKEERVKGLYAQALAFYKNGDLSEAKQRFLEVEVIYPGYKDALRLLETIDAEIQKKQKEVMGRQGADAAEKFYNEALGLYQSGDYAGAKAKFIKAEVAQPDYKDSLKYLARIDVDIDRKSKEEDFKRRSQEAEPIYLQAVALYKDGDFIEAKRKFIALQSVFLGYKDATVYLARLDKDIRDQEERLIREENKGRAEVLYSDALKLYADRQFVDAKARFVELVGLDPANKNALMYLARIDEDIRKESARIKRESLEGRVAEPYAQAVTFYHDGDFELAKTKFLEVSRLISDYKKTRFYLSRVDEDIRTKKIVEDKERMLKAEGLYKQAMDLMAKEKMVESFVKLAEVENIYPDYKAVRSHMEKLRKLEVKNGFNLPEPPISVPVISTDQEQVAALYKEAVELYKNKKYDEARLKFEAVAAIRPGYRSTQKYFDSLHEFRDIAAKKAAAEDKSAKVKAAAQLEALVKAEAREGLQSELLAPAKTADKAVVSPEDAQAIAKLSERSSAIYQQIRSLSEEKELSDTSRTFAKVDRLIENLDVERRRIADQLAREAKAKEAESARIKRVEKEKIVAQQVEALRQKTQEGVQDDQAKLAKEHEDLRKKERDELDRLKDQAREAQFKAEAVYQQAVIFYRQKNYLAAQARLLEVGKIVPDYKDVAKLLMRVERAQDEVKIMAEERQDRDVIKGLAEKSAALNVEILQLSQNKDYPSIEQRFNDLEAILKDIQTVKGRIADRRSEFELRWEKRTFAQRADVKPPVLFEEKAAPRLDKKIEAVVSPEEAQAIAKLSSRSSTIYQQIKSLSEDKQLSDASRTFAKVDRLMGNLEAEHRRIAEQIAREKKLGEAEALRIKRVEKQQVAAQQIETVRQKAENKAEEDIQAHQAQLVKEREELRKKERRDLEQLKDQARESQLKAEVLYQQALGLYRQKDYDAAQARLLEAQKIVPDYKDTGRLLVRVERGQDEVKIMAAEQQDRDTIKGLAEKAASLNIEILALSQKKDYVLVEQRFNDLESILKEIQTVKGAMVDRRSQFETRWEARASERKEDVKKRTPPKAVKEGEDFISPRQKARMLFKEGEQFYAAENFAEARVKFMEAVRQDASFKAPMSYVTRIDRILSQRDFEVHQQQEKAKVRQLEEADQAAEGASGAVVKPAETIIDPERAAQVLAEGVRLYEAGRYREARIKFEELLHVGTSVDQQRASRYLTLIEQALEKEKKVTQAEQRAQEDRYLEERRAQVRLAWERDKKQQERERRKTRELVAVQRELDIRRQQELRAIEEQNLRQRREMLERKSVELAKALHDDEQERTKFSVEAIEERSPLDVKRAEVQARTEVTESIRTEVQGTAVAVDALEQASQEKVETDAKMQKQRRRLEQLESKEERDRRLVQEKERRKIDQSELGNRDASQKRLKDKQNVQKAAVLSQQQEEDLKKSTVERQQQELIRRNQQEVQAILKETPVAPAVSVPAASSAVVIPSTPKGVADEDPAALLLKQAAEQEKQYLQEQRALIRKDFEDGVERLYNEAIGLFKKKMYVQARQDFEQVDKLIKGYKKTAQYLKDTERYSLRSGR